jgi:hypothetical protein
MLNVAAVRSPIDKEYGLVGGGALEALVVGWRIVIVVNVMLVLRCREVAGVSANFGIGILGRYGQCIRCNFDLSV